MNIYEYICYIVRLVPLHLFVMKVNICSIKYLQSYCWLLVWSSVKCSVQTQIKLCNVNNRHRQDIGRAAA